MKSRNQGSSSRHQGAQSQSSRNEMRPGQMNQNSQYGQNYGHNYDQDSEEGIFAGSRQGLRGNMNDDSYDMERSSSARDTDHDFDGSTYGSYGQQDRSQRNLGGRSSRPISKDFQGTYGDYETQDRNRNPSRFGSHDQDRSEYSSERFGSSSDRFGYPQSMNSWRGNDRSTGSGRMGQSNFNSWGSREDSEMGMGSQFGSQSSFGSTLGQEYGSTERSERSGPERGFFGKGPKGWKRSDDRIKEDVCETLARHARIDASDIDVKVEEACVTLSGTVDSKEIKRAAEMAIENLSGVDDVRNEIKVRKMGERSESSIHASSSGSSLNSGLNSRESSSTTSSKSTKGTSHI
jgi:osmotically-inducible protein OsmY